jgi:hypothetical protein
MFDSLLFIANPFEEEARLDWNQRINSKTAAPFLPGQAPVKSVTT